MRGYDDFKKQALGKRKDMKLKQYWYNPKSGKVWPFDGHYGGDEELIKLVEPDTVPNETRLEMDYPETLLRIWRMTDPYAVRYALSFVRVDFGNRYVEATNGKILVRETIKLDEPFWGLNSVLLYGADLRRIARMFDDSGKLFKLKLVNIGKEWFAENADTRIKITTPDEGARFPNTDDIFASKSAKVAKFNVDMKELRRFIAAFGSMDAGGNTGVEITIPLDGEGVAALGCGCRSVNGRLYLMESNESKRVSIEPEFGLP